MDYFFIIELNKKHADVEKLMSQIRELGCEIKYLTAEPSGQGILGIVKATSLTQRDTFFKNIASLVRNINGITDNVYGTSKLGKIQPTTGLATWAYATIGEIVHGLKQMSYTESKGLNPYHIDTILRGGTTNIHGG